MKPARRERFAIVHDHLVQRGGAERVVASMSRLLNATVYTSLYDPERTYPVVDGVQVQTLWLNRLTPFRRNHRWAFPLLVPCFLSARPTADTTILSTIGWAHFARPRGRSVAYWYAPARWLYHSDVYVGHGWKGRIIRLLAPGLRWADRRAVARVDTHLAISADVANRLRAIYGINAAVVHPPVTFSGSPTQVSGLPDRFHLAVSRFMRYKNLDVLLAAYAQRPDLHLVVAGDGPDGNRLRAMAPPNVHFVGVVSDDELAWLYEQCSCLVTAAFEDFGLTPLEAAGFGRPTAALRAHGFLDTILPGRTGVFIEQVSSAAVLAALDEIERIHWEPSVLRNHARQFSEEAFRRRLFAALDSRPEAEAKAR